MITALDFASEGSIVGPVEFDSGLPGYVFADRLFIPEFVTDAYPELAAIFDTSSDAGRAPSQPASPIGYLALLALSLIVLSAAARRRSDRG